MDDLTRNFLDASGDRDSLKPRFDALKQAARDEVLRGLIAALEDGWCVSRERAALALAEIGAQAGAAAPALARMLTEDDCDAARWLAAHALGRLGQAAVPYLAKLLGCGDPLAQGLALDALGEADAGVGSSAPLILDALERGEIHIGASSALAKMGPPALSRLIRALETKDHAIRFPIAMALADMGAEAIPYLLPVVRDAPDPIAADAAYALARLDPEAALPHLVRLLRTSGSDIRVQAAWILGEIGPRAGLAATALAKALHDAEGLVRLKAAQSLARLGPCAAFAIPQIISRLQDEQWNVRMAAAWSLGLFGLSAKAAEPHLILALKDEQIEVRQSAAEALDKMGTRGARNALKRYRAGEPSP